MAPKTNWDSTETWQRLVAAIIATGVKLDSKETAKYFGTTYDTLENRLRKVKKDAKDLQGEIDSGERSEVVATPKKTTKAANGTPTPRKSAAKKDALSTVTNGRVSKTSPTKKTKKAVKQEEKSDDEGDIFTDIEFGAGSGDVSMDGDELVFP